ncbi:efflux RND transporter periplasmic adaptor subunit [Paracoccus sp. MBLB3053]|uniref:Efflux RND transporter periplasmic adaptor subunit n=1 Tax=Paracoccus aurantius TaxID=3073814 RepID=A0ABU2HPF8_9RHOB|nr:efflux RND transporter periplasmic adaptor subunit [Paracoccus sp. MBLB3053]MDS9466934.1 efflux RND transporter periplasmic adaptor subunit [Paracoccus sp. MBLB3053]
MIRRSFFFLAVGLSVTGPAFGFQLPWSAPAPPDDEGFRPVASIIVSSSPAMNHSMPGVIKARTEVSLAFQTLGRLTARNVELGDVVRQGETLATLDPEDLQGQVAAAQAAADAAKVALETAEATAARTRALANRNVTTTANLEQAEQMLATARAAEQQAQSELIRARDTEQFAEMKAPFDGVISSIDVEPGEVVSAGQAVMQLSGQDELEVVIDVQPALLSRLAIGDSFEVWSENHPDIRNAARASRIEPVADAVTRTRRVHLSLENVEGFRLGALVRASPSTGEMTRLTIPRAAILLRQGVPHVWIVSRENEPARVSMRRIVTDSSGLQNQVTVSEGVTAGEEIVIRGIHSLQDGQAVGESVDP